MMNLSARRARMKKFSSVIVKLQSVSGRKGSTKGLELTNSLEDLLQKHLRLVAESKISSFSWVVNTTWSSEVYPPRPEASGSQTSEARRNTADTLKSVVFPPSSNTRRIL